MMVLPATVPDLDVGFDPNFRVVADDGYLYLVPFMSFSLFRQG